jgi:hypothetical protein
MWVRLMKKSYYASVVYVQQAVVVIAGVVLL